VHTSLLAALMSLLVVTGVTVETVAHATGAFRFPALAPGYYDVTASLPGFRSYKFERVEVLLGQVKRLAFVLEIAGVSEEVSVSASSPLVDTRQSARGYSLRQDAIDLLPKGRDFTSLVSQAPGANRSRSWAASRSRVERGGEPVRHQRYGDDEPLQRRVGTQRPAGVRG